MSAFVKGCKRGGHQLVCMIVGFGVLFGALTIATTSAAARLSDAELDQLRTLVATPGFTAAMCPENWAEVHGRTTGKGTERMVAMLQSKAALDSADTVRAAILAFRAHPTAPEFRSAEGLAEIQVYHCLAEAWNLKLM